MSDPTPEEIRASIVPKSDQLNADDLLTGPITVSITGVRKGDKDQPIIVELSGGHRPYKPCKTCRRVLISQYSDDPKKWIGQQLTLWCDPSVTWAGVRVGGIRISHMSGLDGPKTFMLTQTRGKKAEVTIRPIEVSVEDQKFIDSIQLEIAAAETEETLKAIGFVLKTKSPAVRESVRGAYSKRKTELKATKPTEE